MISLLVWSLLRTVLALKASFLIRVLLETTLETNLYMNFTVSPPLVTSLEHYSRKLPACALGGTRTPNLLIRSQMLYPLSYKRWET